MTNQKDKISELECRLSELEKKYRSNIELLKELIYFFMKEVGAGQDHEHRHSIIPEFLIDSIDLFIRRLDPKNQQTNDKKLRLEIFEKLKKYAEGDDRDKVNADPLLKSCIDQLNAYYRFLDQTTELRKSSAEYDIIKEFENEITFNPSLRKIMGHRGY